MYIIWIAIVIGVPGLAFWYIGKRLINPLPAAKNSTRWKRNAWTVLGFVFFLSVGSVVLLRFSESLVHRFAWFTYIMLGLISFVFTFLLIRDGIWLGTRGIQKLYRFGRSMFSDSPLPQSDPARREFILQSSNFGILMLAGSFTGYGIYEARRRPGIVRITVPIYDLPAEFEGFTIVQLTDIHAGLTVKRNWIETIVKEVDDLRPDLIAFTGDLVDGSVSHLRNDVAPLGDLAAGYGKYFVTGNHEYYSGVEPWMNEADRLGFDVLVNEHRLIRRNGASIVLAGVTDYSGGQFLNEHASDPKAAVEHAPPDMRKILLAHQPRTLYRSEDLGIDLIVSGHTHGGQFFPWNLVATIGQPYIKGLHFHNGTWIYVSQGTGYYGPPVRLGARSEITVISLTGSTT